jgi:hypothetical protein
LNVGRKPYRRDELIVKLQALAARLGHTPSQDTVNAAEACPCHQTYVNHFGSWNAALTAAGLALNRRGEPYEREELLAILQRLARELDQAPAHSDLEKRGLPRVKTFARCFGSWREALATIGLRPRAGGRKYKRDELPRILQELAEELGRPPTQKELDAREGIPHSSTYKYHYGSWSEALRAAGLEPHYLRRRAAREIGLRS